MLKCPGGLPVSLYLQFLPQVFYRVQVEWLMAPFQHLCFLSMGAVENLLSCMFWIADLFEGWPTSHLHCPGGWQQIPSTNILIRGSNPFPLNTVYSANTIRKETAQNLSASLLNFTVGFVVFMVVCKANLPLSKADNVIATNLNVYLISHHILPVIYQLLQMFCGKLLTSFNMSSLH